MENRQSQLLPFERNRYYAGKLLTSMDVEAEQDYIHQQSGAGAGDSLRAECV